MPPEVRILTLHLHRSHTAPVSSLDVVLRRFRSEPASFRKLSGCRTRVASVDPYCTGRRFRTVPTSFSHRACVVFRTSLRGLLQTYLRRRRPRGFTDTLLMQGPVPARSETHLRVQGHVPPHSRTRPSALADTSVRSHIRPCVFTDASTSTRMKTPARDRPRTRLVSLAHGRVYTHS